MKKLIALTFAALLYCGPAAAGSNNVVDALGGVLNGLSTSLQQANLQSLVNSLAGSNGLIQGDIAAPLNNTLSGLLVDTDPAKFANNLGVTLTLTLNALGKGLTGSGGAFALPGLSSQASGPGAGVNSLALPGLQGGEGFSAAQLSQLDGLIN